MTSSARIPIGNFVQSSLEALRDTEKAGPMQSYMRTDMPFYGVQQRDRVPIVRDLLRLYRCSNQEEYEESVLAIWDLPHREEKYIAIEYARQSEHIVLESLPLYERMIRQGAWWDLVDPIAVHLVGVVWLKDRDHVSLHMDVWIRDDDPWIRRTAIIGQLKHGAATDEERLFRYCLEQAAERDFFIRKAIGWALRQYSYTKPDTVRDFLTRHADVLSPLSRKEAAKGLERLASQRVPKPELH